MGTSSTVTSAAVLLALLMLLTGEGVALVGAQGGAALPITDGYYTANFLVNPDFCTQAGQYTGDGSQGAAVSEGDLLHAVSPSTVAKHTTYD
jgi:hypothetical protein